MLKKVFYCIVSAALLISMLCMFTRIADDGLVYTDILNRQELTGSESSEPTDKSSDQGLFTFQDNKILISSTAAAFDTLYLKLSDPVSRGGEYYLYTVNSDNAEDKTFIAYGSVAEDGLAVFFSVPNSPEGRGYEITSDQSLSPTELSLIDTKDGSTTLKLNIPALIFFIAIVILLLLTEKRIRFFSTIIEAIKSEKRRLSELWISDKAKFVSRLGAVVSTSAFIATTLVLLVLSYYSSASVVAVFVMSCIAIAFQICDRIANKRDAHPAELFLAIGLLFGLMVCYTAPVSTHVAWDDEIHFQFAYKSANPHTNNFSLALHKLFTRNYRVADFIESPRDFADTLVKESGLLIKNSYPRSFVYSALSYSPFIASILVANAFGADIITTITLCRTAGMLAYMLIVYTGIKKLKSGAYIFSAVCLLPCTLFLSTSIGYDMWLTAWFAYAFAHLISVFQDENGKIQVSDVVKITLALFLGCAAKGVYLFMITPLLFISNRKFSTRKLALASKITLLGVMVLIAALIFFAGVQPDSRGGDNVNIAEQLLFILKNPLSYTAILFKHIGNYCSTLSFTEYSSVFGFLTSYTANPNHFFGTFALFILIYAIFTDRRKDDCYQCADTQRLKWTTLGACLLQVMAISTVMYLCYTNVGSSSILGCQFRYLFPLLLPFCYFILPKGISFNGRKAIQNTIIFGGLAINLITGYLASYIYKFIW